MKTINTFFRISLFAISLILGCSSNNNTANIEANDTNKQISLANVTNLSNTTGVQPLAQTSQIKISSQQIPANISTPQKRNIDFTAKSGKVIGSIYVDKLQPTELNTENINLIIDSGAVKNNVEISIVEINNNKTAGIPDNMENLTKDSKCYRMLPDGQKFEKDITIAIKYDSTQLPYGYTEEDIYTFFYNEELGLWQQVERDSINKEKQLVYSRTNHFTDYINGILKVPESSDAMAYTPTSIKDLKAADPMNGITLMSPPEANNKGTVNLSYPLNIPAGRRGMQPNLNITYNSAGGSGWLGLGWNLNVSEITVETRWGVPLYDENQESETYLLDGETLVTFDGDDFQYNATKVILNEPTYRSWRQENRGATDFRTRVEGQFRKIVRHGDSPQNYWWEVIDRSGTRYLYGCEDGDNIDTNSVFRSYVNNNNSYSENINLRKNIAKWKLRKVIDIYGNTIDYHYKLITNGGYQQVLDYITYTGFQGDDENGESMLESGKYKIVFKISDIEKPAQSISFRNGFRESDKVLLDKIQVLFDNDTIKEYYFAYMTGGFGRTLLCKIFESYSLDRNQSYKLENNPVYVHKGENILKYGIFERCDFGVDSMSYIHLTYSFDYEIPTSILESPNQAKTITYQSGNISNYLNTDMTKLKFDERKDINGTKSKSWNIGGGLDIGLGWTIFSKTLSAGGNYMYSEDESETLLSMVDLDGDGYADKLFKNGNNLKYRLRIPSDDNTILFGSIKSISSNSNQKNFQKSKSTSDNWGFEASLSGTASYAANWSDTRSSTYVYLADVNADGLVDIVNNGRVYTNQYYLTGNIGFKDVTDDTTIVIMVDTTCGKKTIRNDIAVDTSVFSRKTVVVEKTVCDTNTTIEYETIYTSHIELDSTCFVAECKINEVGDTIYTQHRILTTDCSNLNLFSPTAYEVDSLTYEHVNNTAFRVGIYGVLPNTVIDTTIVKKSNVSYDNCHIEYDTIPYEIPKRYNPNIDLVRLWIAPFSGEVKISGTAKLSEDFQEYRKQLGITDGVKLGIQQNNNLFLSKELHPDSNSVSMSTNTLAVTKGDKIFFILNSAIEREYDKVEWNPIITYQKVNGNIITQPQSDANAKNPYIFNYQNDFSLDQKQVITHPFDCSDSVKVHITSNGNQLTEDMRFSFVSSSGNSTFSPVIFQRGDIVNSDITFRIDTISQNSDLYFTLESLNGGQLNWSDIETYVSVMIVEIINDTDDISESLKNDGASEWNYVYHPAVFYKNAYDYKAVVGNTFIHNDLVITSFYLTPVMSGILTIKPENKNLPMKTIHVSTNTTTYINYTLLPNTKYYFDYYTGNTSMQSAMTTLVDANTHKTYNIDAGIYCRYDTTYNIYGNMYRNWGHFGYKRDASETLLINTSALQLNTKLVGTDTNSLHNQLYDTTTVINITEENNVEDVSSAYNPLKEDKFFLMNVSIKDTAWIGYGNILYAKKNYIGLTHISQANSSEVDVTYSPIPIAQQNSRILAVNKNSVSTGKGKTGSIGIQNLNLNLNAGFNTSYSNSVLTSDFIDMNGDKFPDILSTTEIQYSSASGGLSDIKRTNGGIDKSYNENSGESYGSSFVDSQKEIANNPKTSKTIFKCSGGKGGSANNSKGTSETKMTLVDINGDGLPDRLYNDGRIYFNTGYGWEEDNAYYDITSIRMSTSNSCGVSINGNYGLEAGETLKNTLKNKWNTSLSAGLGYNYTTNETNYAFFDINGDGLLDLINGNIVWFNTGKSFSSPINMGVDFDIAHTVVCDASVAVTFGFTLGFFIPVKTTVNPKGGGMWNRTLTDRQWIDMNNDGIPDYIYKEGNVLKVRYSNLAKINLLKHVSSVMGAEYFIDYTLSESNKDCSQRHWNMTSLKVFDGYVGDGQDTIKTKFEYKNRYYDRYERDDYGYDTVIIYEYDNNLKYRTKVQAYHNKDYMFNGLLKYDLVTDADNNKYIENVYTYQKALIHNGNIDESGNEYCGSVYPVLTKQETFYYEGSSSPSITTKKEWEYGRFGNVERFYDYEDVNINNDDIYSEIDYNYNTENINTVIALINKHILSLPTAINVYDFSGYSIRNRNASYTDKGDIMELRVTTGSEEATYNYEYDIYGNLRDIKFPINDNNERIHISYIYDNIIHCLPVQTINNSYGYTSYANYDYHFAVPTSTIDIAGNIMHYTYDCKGRVKTITSPLDSTSNYTIKYAYWDTYNYGQSLKTIKWDYLGKYLELFAKTSHYDQFQSGNDLETITFSDGLGRPIQVKKDMELGSLGERFVCSGWIYYDGLGRRKTEFHPTIDNLISSQYILHGTGNHILYKTDKEYRINKTISQIQPTQYSYDILNRNTQTIFSDSTVVSNEYAFDADELTNNIRFKTTVIDQNTNPTQILTDTRDLKVQVKDALNHVTHFIYNSIGELIESIDPEHHSTKYAYDIAGRLIQRQHPSSGTTQWQYDNAGNVIKQIQNSGEYISYVYDYNHLKEIHYSDKYWNDVWYEYGQSGNGNQTGRLVKQQDATGVQEFQYDKLGNVSFNRHTYILPNSNHTFTLESAWSYDSWGRVLAITYPDKERVEYSYDKGGNLKSILGYKQGQGITSYIDSIRYDLYGQRVFEFYNNGITTRYDYNLENRRLERLTNFSPNGLLQANIYRYDYVGNIIQITDNGLHPREQYFKYDAINRLIGSDGHVYHGTDLTYTARYKYSMSGRLTEKIIDKGLRLNNKHGIYPLIYDNVYNYNENNNPYAVRNITNQYTGRNIVFDWDAKGNLLHYFDDAVGIGRFMCWTEDNRLQAFKEINNVFQTETDIKEALEHGLLTHDDISSRSAYYNYDANGERNLKLTSPELSVLQNSNTSSMTTLLHPTLYASALVTLTERNYTKHYFEEGRRICSKIGGGFANTQWNQVSSQVTPITDSNYFQLINNQIIGIHETFDICMHSEVEIIPEVDLFQMLANEKLRNDPEITFYYHSDHLGSAAYLTNQGGLVTQILNYLPYGEDWVNVQNYNEMPQNILGTYSFNGKEKDYESGFHYYGSRYYSSEISMWLSTDPMADKYPNTSLYAYCSNNPIILVDPDGMDWFRSDETGCVLWSNKNDKKIEHDGEFYRNIGTSYKEYKDGIIFQYGNSRTEASITEVNDEDRKFYFDGGQFIPSTFYTDDGTKVNISFLYNSPTGGNGDKPLSTEMVSALISAVNDVNSGKNNKITMLDVSTTTTGKHSKNSSHYTQNGARAVDIDIINNIPLRNKNSHKLANRLQNAFDRLNVINYGPEHNWLQGHDNHIHANIKNR